jgi:putative ABC transport system substrate-binding protein
MKRREFIRLLGGAAAWPFSARAQQPGMPVIGFLNAASPEAWTNYLAGFRQGLAQVGFIEGTNTRIEYRWARGRYDALPALAAELAALKVDVIAANGGARSAIAAKSVTGEIPIVFTFGDGDPVTYGLVESFHRPGGNVTGVTMIAGTLEPKRMELLREIAPKATLVHMLINPTNAGIKQDLPHVEAAARKMGLGLQVLSAATQAEIDAAFDTIAAQHAQALMVANDGFFTVQAPRLAAHALRLRVPAIFPWREQAAAGGLISYGTSIREAYRQSGIYVGQVLKGTKPADLPVQQPTKFELVINLSTAKVLGLEVPMSLLMRVDEVIE